MLIRLLEFAEYSELSADNKLIIGGIFNQINVVRTAEIEPGAPDVIQVAPLWLIFIAEASLADGLAHSIGLRIVNEDGHDVWSGANMGEMNFILNPQGWPMRFHGRMNLSGLQLPGAGDYSFEFLVDGSKKAETRLYVQVHNPPA